MESLIIENTGDTPKIVLDPENDNFEISYRSLPENANGFYEPVFNWFDQYMDSPGEAMDFNFNLEYFNTASAKQIAKILLMLEKLSQKIKVKIIWHYKKDDTDMFSSGKRYSKLLKVEFELKEIA